MTHNDAVAGSTVTLVADVVDQVTLSKNPVTGQAPTVAIQRLSDDKWFDFVAVAWDTFASYSLIGASNKQALADEGDGSYEYEWDQEAADAGSERIYEMTYEVPAGDYQGTTEEQWNFRASASVLLNRTLGLAGENQYIDNPVFDTNGRMTSARLRTYSVAASVGTTNDVLATYTITATYTGAEIEPTTFKMVKA